MCRVQCLWLVKIPSRIYHYVNGVLPLCKEKWTPTASIFKKKDIPEDFRSKIKTQLQRMRRTDLISSVLKSVLCIENIPGRKIFDSIFCFQTVN